MSILAPNGVKKIAELGNSLRRLHLPREYKQYSEFDKQRLLVVPGCTGLWQVSGRNGLSFDQMVNLDLQYITHRSIIGDIEIMLRTFRIFVIPNQAY
ncbi:sugar transferase [Lacticaseibacillus paracasei]|uniref:sugar transferase n=1 Tax=Lacticaseibacillus paracasei TaxID=1597 RepID=UPI0027391101|nr:sugar transferase [Lacticaseibacillus paracasei]MDP4467175.1 sugar transferase [Lacticaseibacillus paracasei]